MQEAKKFNISSFISRKIKLLLCLAVVLFYGFLLFYLSNFSIITPSSNPRLYSNQNHDDLKALFLNAIQTAKNDIYLEIFGLTDQGVINALNQKAESGCFIFIRYDPTGSPNLASKLSPCIKSMPILLKGLMHRKVLVIDDELVVLGTANLTASSLLHHDNVVLSIWDKHLASFIKSRQEFYYQAAVDEQNITFYLLPEKKSFVSKEVASYLNSAKKTIKVAMFTLTHPQLTQSLIAAHKRGVEVEVALDALTAKGASFKSTFKLFQAGIPIKFSKGKKLLHHKWAIIDDKIFIMGSANWTKSAFEKNEDFILIINPLDETQKEVLKHIWQKIEEEKDKEMSFEKLIA